MKRLAALFLLIATGCSTRPLAGFCDRFFPARPIPPSTQGIGGVQNQLAPPPDAVLLPPPPGGIEVPAPPIPVVR